MPLYALKAVRASGWLLLGIMLLYLVSGFALCGELGLDRLLSVGAALRLHKGFVWPLVALLAVHVVASAYLALRRWGWISWPERP